MKLMRQMQGTTRTLCKYFSQNNASAYLCIFISRDDFHILTKVVFGLKWIISLFESRSSSYGIADYYFRWKEKLEMPNEKGAGGSADLY